MNCRDWEERIALYAGGDATPAEAVEAERHVAGCAGCQVLLSGLRESLRLLRAEHQEPVEEAHFAAVRARVLAQIESAPARWWKVWAYVLAAAVLAAMLLVAVRPGARPVPATPKMALVTPQPVQMPVAPLVSEAPDKAVVPALPRPRLRPVVQQQEPAETLTVKLVTDNPDVVIYWIAEKKGD